MTFVKLKGSWKELHLSRQISQPTIHRYLRTKFTNVALSFYDFICIADITVTPFYSSRFSTLLC